MTLDEFKSLNLLDKLDFINGLAIELEIQSHEITEFLRDTWDD